MHRLFRKCRIVYGLVLALVLVVGHAMADGTQATGTIQDLRRQVFERPNDPLAHNDLAIALAQSGQWPEAIGQFKTAVSLDSSNVQYRINLASAEANSGDSKSALATYASVTRVDPSNALAHLGLAELYVSSGRVHESLAEFALAESLLPESYEIHYEYGNALLSVGEWDGAQREYGAGLEIQPSNTSCLIALASVQAEEGRVSGAIGTLTTAIGLQTMNPVDESQAHLQLAALYLQSKQATLAVAELRKSATLTPDDPQVHNALGAALFAEGDSKDAIVEWKCALRSNDRDAQRAARQWLSCM